MATTVHVMDWRVDRSRRAMVIMWLTGMPGLEGYAKSTPTNSMVLAIFADPFSSTLVVAVDSCNEENNALACTMHSPHNGGHRKSSLLRQLFTTLQPNYQSVSSTTRQRWNNFGHILACMKISQLKRDTGVWYLRRWAHLTKQAAYISPAHVAPRGCGNPLPDQWYRTLRWKHQLPSQSHRTEEQRESGKICPRI